jgi:hypothetical protein
MNGLWLYPFLAKVPAPHDLPLPLPNTIPFYSANALTGRAWILLVPFGGGGLFPPVCA